MHATQSQNGTIVIVNSDSMGSGDESLGRALIHKYLFHLAAVENKPDAIIFYNGAVRLLSAESQSLESLRQLEQAGVELMACTTCLEFFALIEGRAIGMATDMRTIVQRTLGATKTVTI